LRRKKSQGWLAIRGSLALLLASCIVLLAPGRVAPALAGDTFGNGDCWRSGTPLLCRTNWVSGGLLPIRLVDYMGNSGLHAAAETARANWSAATGPQLLSWSPQSNDSLVNLWQDNSRPDGGYTANYDSNGTLCGYNPCNIFWSDIYVTQSILSCCNRTAASTFAHEFGHALGLDHHTNEVVLMTPSSPSLNNPYEGPQPIDIGPSPACQGLTNSYHGIRCIYDW
jgi:hypothetical protein